MENIMVSDPVNDADPLDPDPDPQHCSIHCSTQAAPAFKRKHCSKIWCHGLFTFHFLLCLSGWTVVRPGLTHSPASYHSYQQLHMIRYP